MVIRMPDKYRRYGNGGGVMSLSERAEKQVSRDIDRGGPDPKAEFRAKLERRKAMRPSMGISGLAGMASGGMVGFQEGGEIEAEDRLDPGGQYYDPYYYAGQGYQGYQMPADYASPQSYGGYGMPAQFQQRQEHLSPEVAQQYADLTKGIMRAGTRGYEDVRYKGPQLAGFTDMEAAAQAGAGAYGRGAGPQGTLQSAATISEAARGIGSLVPRQQTMATDPSPSLIMTSWVQVRGLWLMNLQ
jgi:hypothetical protein